ncbi:MAG: Holliday junction resolvase RuvX [Clostridia bacterium]
MSKIMAIDYGDAHVGIAFSDLSQTLAGDAFTLHERNLERVVLAIKSYVFDNDVSEIVLGYPKNMNATIGPRGEKSELLAATLRSVCCIPVILWDERQTTVAAHQILNATGTRGKNRKNKIDAVAATLILQGYLDFKTMHK